ncbi:hypothetical protein C8R44DRAFT_726620 [Mycena epipterygia]|nr:hypothetical protein C8R44DRAFT_726620 [Mycena epipterygia]
MYNLCESDSSSYSIPPVSIQHSHADDFPWRGFVYYGRGVCGLVVIANLNEEGGAKFASELNEKLAGFQKATSTFKRIAYVFANAEIAEHPWLAPFDPETVASRPLVKPELTTANINLTGQLYTATLALQTFERQEIGPSGFCGRLILTTAMPLYATSKAVIINFMRSAAQYYATKNITVNSDTQIVPNFFFVPFRERKLLSDLKLVLDQFEELLGESPLNGQARSVSQGNVWVHPTDTHMLEENDPACDLLSVELFKLFGDKTL